MSRTTRVVAALTMLSMLAGVAVAATQNPPDDYLCYAAGSGNKKKLKPISGQRTSLQDRFGGPQSFVLRRLSELCNPATRIGAALSHAGVHLVGITMKKEKKAPKFVPFTLGVRDRFDTRTLELTAVASVLDVTPVQPGTTAPADFSDDPTTVADEVNRFKCYTAALPKGVKFVPPTAPTIVDDGFPGGQQMLLKKVTKVCVPADVEGATPGAETRGSLLVCYAVKLPRGAKYLRETVGTRSRTVGVRIVGRRKPAELCVTGRVFPGG